MNLEQLRKQAKELVRAGRAGDDAALARLGDLPPILASAQLVLARERGYKSWPELVHALEADVERFVLAAVSRRRDRAEAMLARRPEIERERWARLVLGRGWDSDPNEVGGPCSWAPLHYVCHSCFASIPLAQDLLRRRADPNAYFANEYGPISTLYGAAGVLHDPELTRVLLDGGADPNGEPHFGDALYHACEAESPECVRVLLDHGAEPNGTNALAHALDYDHLEHVRLLLDAGAEPSGAIVAHAVRRGRGPEFLRLLAERGADLNRPGGETWRGDIPLRSPYRQAFIRGREDQVQALAELGASIELSDEDKLLGAIARGERPAGRLPDSLDPDASEVVILSALNGPLELVLEIVGPNFRGFVGGGPAGTLLHHAAWIGSPGVVRELLARGADPVAQSGAQFDTPIAWAALGSQDWELPGRDYVRVGELLLDAGAELEPRFADVAHGPLEGWLEGRI